MEAQFGRSAASANSRAASGSIAANIGFIVGLMSNIIICLGESSRESSTLFSATVSSVARAGTEAGSGELHRRLGEAGSGSGEMDSSSGAT